jgi:protein gp37
MGKTSIEWTDQTWNPVRGCVKISPGCKHCYSETFAERWRGIPGHPYERGFDPRYAEDQLTAPLSWRKPSMVFVNSMSDLFLDQFAFDYIGAVYGVMAQSPRHTYQVLTKRPERRVKFFKWVVDSCGGDDGPPPDEVVTILAANRVDLDQIPRPWPLQNVWEGVSVESTDYLDRIDILRETPAVVRFLSLEPLLGPLPNLDLRGIGWVIVGGESGLGARPMDPDWVRDIRDQCLAAGVPFFFKQHGGRLKKKAGRELDGRTWDEMPVVRSGRVAAAVDAMLAVGARAT